MDETAQLIEDILKETLQAVYVEIIDESYLHRGHKAAGGGGHYAVIVVSEQFAGVNPLDRRRLVYGALDEQINGQPKRIHAIQIKTFTPAQWEEAGNTV
ncbi:BolA family protein [Nitrospina watsonii]|uniref:Cell division protein BolA n=1 Tax=Nitrospina watsonii TaxID=1323948 RepID=A0ABN8VWS2_9BACT|nr:BolA family protein [Nitrospina watsonii]CAI2718234.1 Cell division protein BolA [Nitrospina watsonii]